MTYVILCITPEHLATGSIEMIMTGEENATIYYVASGEKSDIIVYNKKSTEDKPF